MEERIMSYGVNENVIEFLRNQETMTCTFSQGRFVSKVKKLAEKYPDEVQIVVENKDGSIVAHIPVKYLHLSRHSRDLTEDEREELAERAREMFHK
jgi:hypothetical protein